jgi:hypothetical protein
MWVETASVAVMIEIRAVLTVSTIVVLMAGCGPSGKTPLSASTTTAAKPDVTIT